MVGPANGGGWLAALAAAAALSVGPPVPAAAQTIAPVGVVAENPPGAVAATAPPGISPRLAEAAEQALRTNPALGAARATIRAAGHDIRAARWLRYPSVAVSAVTRDDRFGVSPEIQILQPLWAGGRISGAIDRARAVREVAQAQLNETAFEMLGRLSDSYHEIARSERLIEIYQDSLAEHRRLVESMERRVRQEVSPRTDLELARSRLAQVEQELATAAAQHDAAMRRFLEIVGDERFDPGEPPPYSPTEHHPPAEGAVERALHCDPTIQRSNAEVRVAEADRRLARAATRPQFGVQYSYDRFRGNQVGAVVKMDTTGGLSPFALADAAEARRLSSEMRVAAAEREVREEVGLDVVANRSARIRLPSTSAAAQSTANVTESFLRQFVAGRRTWLDVMNAVREAIAARVALVDVESSAMASAARLQLRTCAWQPDTGAGTSP